MWLFELMMDGSMTNYNYHLWENSVVIIFGERGWMKILAKDS